MGSNGARLGSKRFLPEMRAFADLLKDTLDHGIPGHEGINPAQWCEKFAPDFDVNLIYKVLRCQRTPTIEKSIRLGSLMKKSGAKIGLYDFLRAAADGIWSEISKETEVEDFPCGQTLDVKPQKVNVSPTAEYAVDVYEKLSWEDRITAANGLLQAIARDVKIYKMIDDRDVIQELTREAIESRSRGVNYFAEIAEIPVEWLRAIVDGQWDKVEALTRTDYILNLSDKVKNLDGKTRDCEFFAPLIPKDQVKSFLREAKKRLKN